MSINKEQLRSVLPQCNDGAELAACWQQYYEYYQYGDLVNTYVVHIDNLAINQQDIVFQFFTQRHQHSKGIFIIVHGYMDHSGLYHHIVRKLLEQGFDVLIYDQQGHGVSSGERYGIDDFCQYGQQLNELIARFLTPQSSAPCYLIGQSTGATVVMEYLLNTTFTVDSRIKKATLLAPLVRNHRFFLTKVHHYLTRCLIKKIKRSNSTSSHDKKFLNLINNEDPLGHKYMKANWIGAMINWQLRFKQYQPCTIDMLVIQGSDDTTVSWQYNLRVIQQKFTASEQVVIAGAKHNLVNELSEYRDQVFNRLC